jgi:hypothetical protein
MVSDKLLRELGFEPVDRYDYMWVKKAPSICADKAKFMYIMILQKVKGDVLSIGISPLKRFYGAAYYYTGKCDSDDHFIKLLKDTGLYGYCSTNIDVRQPD